MMHYVYEQEPINTGAELFLINTSFFLSFLLSFFLSFFLLPRAAACVYRMSCYGGVYDGPQLFFD